MLAPQGIVKRGLVGWYDFTDAAGSQVLADKSGHGNHGQNGSTTGADTNDATFNGQKAVFGDDDYIKMPYSVDIEKDFSVFVVATIPAMTSVVMNYVTFGNSGNDTPAMGLNLRTTGELWFIHGNDAAATSMAKMSAGLMGSGVKCFGIKRVVNRMIIKNLATGVINDTAANYAAGPTTLTHACLSGMLKASMDHPITGQSIFASLWYDRATTNTDDKKNYRALQRTLAERGIVI